MLDIRRITTTPITEAVALDEAHVGSLAASMRSVGYSGEPIITYGWPEGEIYTIDGHHRMAAAKMAGIESVPCLCIDLSDDEAEAEALIAEMQACHEAEMVVDVYRQHGYHVRVAEMLKDDSYTRYMAIYAIVPADVTDPIAYLDRIEGDLDPDRRSVSAETISAITARQPERPRPEGRPALYRAIFTRQECRPGGCPSEHSAEGYCARCDWHKCVSEHPYQVGHCEECLDRGDWDTSQTWTCIGSIDDMAKFGVRVENDAKANID